MALESKIKCDSCGRMYNWKPELAGKKVKCKCGAAISVPAQSDGDIFDIAEPEADPSAPMEYQAPQPPATGKPFRKRKKEGMAVPPPLTTYAAEKTGKGKQIAIIVAVLVIVIGAVVGAPYYMPHSHAPQIPDNLPGEDSRVAHLMADQGSMEVHKFLDKYPQGGVTGFIWTRGKTQQIADMWYKQGAKNVLAFGEEFTTLLAIELPDDKDQRAYFFQWAEDYRGRNANLVLAPQTDVGQKYLVIDLVTVRGMGGM